MSEPRAGESREQPSTSCPTEDMLFEFVDGEMDAVSQVEMLRHLAECEKCAGVVAELVCVMNELSAALREPAEAETPSQEDWAEVSGRVFEELRDAGVIRESLQRKAMDVARKMGRDAVRGAGFVTAATWTGVKTIYSKREAISKVATGAGKVAVGAGKAVETVFRIGAWGLARA